jgi:hypothetical protein
MNAHKLYLVNATVPSVADEYGLKDGWHCLIWAYEGYADQGEVVHRWRSIPSRAAIACASRQFATGLNELGEMNIELCGYSAMHRSLQDNIDVVEARLKQAGVNTQKILDSTRQQIDQAKKNSQNPFRAA